MFRKDHSVTAVKTEFVLVDLRLGWWWLEVDGEGECRQRRRRTTRRWPTASRRRRTRRRGAVAWRRCGAAGQRCTPTARSSCDAAANCDHGWRQTWARCRRRPPASAQRSTSRRRRRNERRTPGRTDSAVRTGPWLAYRRHPSEDWPWTHRQRPPTTTHLHASTHSTTSVDLSLLLFHWTGHGMHT